MSKITSRHLFFVLTVFALLFVPGASRSLAQSAVTGAIAGSVTDPNNATIANATVTLRSLGTNREETVTTGNEGRFRFTTLQPGIYNLTIKATGFTDYKQEQILVEVGRLTDIDATLKIAGAEATVEVIAESSAVNTESKEFATNINQTAINELPINGRRWSNFALLTPGSVADGNFGLISFRGISGLLNNNTVDGGDNNQAFFSEERGRTRISYSISQSSIREFQVNTSNYSAEYGRAAGGVVNAVTKSGTNEFHGDAFYYQRNNEWGARNPRAFQSILSGGATTTVGIKPEDVRHQFGGTIGGPIVKDHLFFFFSYDQQKRNFPGLAIFTNPNYLNTVNRTALKDASRGLTDAQIDSTLAFINSVSGPVPRKGDQTLILPKIDWQINSKNNLSVTYNRLRWDSPAGIQTQPTNTRGIASFGDDFVKIDWGTVRLQTTITPTLLNEFRFQYARDFEFQVSQPPAPGEPRTALNGSSPSVVLTNGLEFGKPDFLERRAFPDEKRWQYTDNVTYATGPYTIKFGVDVNHVKDVLDNLRFESGGYGYNNINDFIIDYVNFRSGLPASIPCVNSTRTRGRCYTSNFSQGFGPTFSELSTTDFNAYAQLDWKFTPRVNFNLGMRYEYQILPDAKNPNPNNTLIPNTDLTLNQATSQLPNDRNNFGPRFGFAVDLTGDGKTSVRGGYGLYYGRIINSTISNAVVNTGAPGGQFQISLAPTATTAPIFPNVLASAPAGTGAIQYFAPNFGNPMIHQADLIFERQIARNTSVSASYLFSLGRKLPTFVDRNLGVPNETRIFPVVGGPLNGQSATVQMFPTARPITTFAQITEIQSSVKSQYNALVLQANRRFTNGLQFIASYTLAKATDRNQTSTTFTTNNVPFDVFNPSLEDATSNFDVRHKVVVSAVFAPRLDLSNKFADLLLDGWQIAPIFQYYTGRPFSGFVSGSSGGAGSLNRSGGANRFPLLGRNSFREPEIWNFDLRISRKFYIRERVSFEILGEAFNLFNRTQVTQLNGTLYNLNTAITPAHPVPTLDYNNPFGTITAAGGTLFRERQVQIAARFQF